MLIDEKDFLLILHCVWAEVFETAKALNGQQPERWVVQGVGWWREEWYRTVQYVLAVLHSTV